MFRTVLLTVVVLCLVQGCETPAKVIRTPSLGHVSTSAVGDFIYRYENIPAWSPNPFGGPGVKHGKQYSYELLYDGVSKGTLRLSYREFVNDMARPSFTQQSTYDMAPGKKTVITFKGAKIEVVSADNNEIKYNVLQGFSNETRTVK